jgi:hypothetical protein
VSLLLPFLRGLPGRFFPGPMTKLMMCDHGNTIRDAPGPRPLPGRSHRDRYVPSRR